MRTYLCEYAQVTKEDLSPKLATLFPVRFSNIFCKCCVNDELEKGAPFEFWNEIEKRIESQSSSLHFLHLITVTYSSQESCLA